VDRLAHLLEGVVIKKVLPNLGIAAGEEEGGVWGGAVSGGVREVEVAGKVVMAAGGEGFKVSELGRQGGSIGVCLEVGVSDTEREVRGWVFGLKENRLNSAFGVEGIAVLGIVVVVTEDRFVEDDYGTPLTEFKVIVQDYVIGELGAESAAVVLA